MKKRAWLLGMVCTCVAITGCGDDDGGGPTVAELPPLLASAICDVFVECFGPGTPKDLTGADCVTTQTAAIQDGDFQYLQDAIAAGRVVYRSDRVQACIDDITSATCAAIGVGSLPESCSEAVAGTLEEGDLCGLDEECAGETYCRMNAACPGTCTAVGAVNEACVEDDHCARGLGCNGGVCTAPASAGEACGGGTEPPCILGTLCSDEGTTPGTCVAIVDIFSAGAGDPCSLDDQELCGEGLVCAATLTNGVPSFECEATVAAGAACKLAVPDQCPPGQFCDVNPSTSTFTSTCKPLPLDGQTCTTFQNQCAARHECGLDQRCHAVNRIGGECEVDSHCSSEHCDDGTCVAPMQCNPDA